MHPLAHSNMAIPRNAPGTREKIFGSLGFVVSAFAHHRQFNHATKRGVVTVPGKPNDELARYAQQHPQTGGPEVKYLIVIEPTSTGFSAYSPDLAGCVSTGATRQEGERNMAEAIAFHLDGLREEGEAAPQPATSAAFVEVA